MERQMASSPETRIRQIDRLIDGIRLELARRVGRISIFDAGSWQRAWDRHPDLRQCESALFRQRGLAQCERDTAAYKAEQKRKAAERRAFKKRISSPCLSCGAPMFAEAV